MTELSFVEQVDAKIDKHHLLNHPFYQAWNAGELDVSIIREYAAQYFKHVSSFPRYLSSIHTNCDDIHIRKILLENLVDAFESNLEGERHMVTESKRGGTGAPFAPVDHDVVGTLLPLLHAPGQLLEEAQLAHRALDADGKTRLGSDRFDEVVPRFGKGGHQRAQVPKVMVRIDDRQTGFEDLFGSGHRSALSLAVARVGDVLERPRASPITWTTWTTVLARKRREGVWLARRGRVFEVGWRAMRTDLQMH